MQLSTALLFSLLCAPQVLRAQDDLGWEGHAQAIQYFNRKFRSCDENSVARHDNGTFVMLNVGMHKLVTTPERLTGADTANGIAWRGSSRISAPARRDWSAGRGWTPWQAAFSSFTVLLTKRSGRWLVEPDYYSDTLKSLSAPDCADVPRERTAAQAQAEQRQQGNNACAGYLNALAGREITPAAVFIGSGLIINGCRDQRGTPILVLAARACKVQDVRDLLEAGGNPNLASESGASALDAAQGAAGPSSTGDCAETVRMIKNRGGKPGTPK